MSTQDNNSLAALIAKLGLRIGKSVIDDSTEASVTSGNLYVDANGKLAQTALVASTPVYVDSSSVLQNGAIPFAFPLSAGATDTSFSTATIVGSSTLTANDIMHQTLVAGAGVTTFTKTGFIRVTVTDNGGNITNGAHYIQIGTLS